MSDKIYEVPADWRKRAFADDAKYRDMYARSVKDPDGFWAEQAGRLTWIEPPRRHFVEVPLGRIAVLSDQEHHRILTSRVR